MDTKDGTLESSILGVWQEAAKKNEDKLDPVNKDAVKKDFDDRKDKDIDNDGDNDAFFHDFYREIFYYENVDNLSPAPQIACCPGPVAECQDFAVNLDLTNFQASILASDIDNGSTADCGLQSITVNPSLFDCSDVGENTVTLTVTDVNGNTDDCTATVTVGF